MIGRPRRRTKTYTGCFRCRQRKVKCDLTQPTCLQCKRVNTVCDGYDVRLRWTNSEEDDGACRRKIEFVRFPANMSYSSVYQVDDELVNLDQARPDSNTIVAGPFGVFNCPKPAMKRQKKRMEDSSWLVVPNWDFQPVPHQWRSTGHVEEEPTENLVFELKEGDKMTIMHATRMPFIFTKLTPLGHYLLSVYRDVVIPHRSVMWSSLNVWSDIYCPRFLSCISDILASGATTCARYVLLYSSFALSASFLRRDFRIGSEGYKECDRIGLVLHKCANFWLKRCFQQKSIGKYKDMIVGIQSLFVVEMMQESRRSQCELLHGISQQLITSNILQRSPPGKKLVYLHRISALDALFEAASGTWPSPSAKEFGLGWIDEVFADADLTSTAAMRNRAAVLAKSESRRRPLDYISSKERFEKYIDEYTVDHNNASENSEDEGTDSFEFSYGVPLSLAYLFKEAVMTASSLLSEPERSVRLKDEDFATRCVELEAALANWKNLYTPPSISAPVADRTSEGHRARIRAIIDHHTLAFYDAIIVYYYRAAKGVNSLYLQDLVYSIIKHLEAIRLLNTEVGEPIVVPIYFTGFIGACTASDKDTILCSRYEIWMRDMDAFSIFRRRWLVDFVRELRQESLGLSNDWWKLARCLTTSLNLT